MIYSQLRAFHAVAREGGFTKAARALHISQPAISTHIKALEAAYGVTLFARHNRKAALTEPGQRLFEIVHRIFRLEEEAEDILRSARGREPSQLRVGTDAPYSVSGLMAAYCQRHPGVKVSLTLATGEETQHNLLNGTLDVAVLVRTEPDPRFLLIPYSRHRIVTFVYRNHPWARRSHIRLRDLAEQPMVLRDTRFSLTSQIFETRLAAAEVKPKQIMKVDSRETMRELVAAGVGIGVIVEMEAAHDRRIKALPIEDTHMTISEAVVCLKQRSHLGAIRSFLDLARELAEPIPPDEPAPVR